MPATPSCDGSRRSEVSVAAPEPLVTARLRLEPFAGQHLSERYVGWLNDPEVVKYSEQRHRHHTLESCRAFVEGFAGSADCLWAIVIAGSARHVGNIAAYVDTVNGIADVSIMIGDRAAWGQGIGLEAWQAVCNYLLDRPGIRKVTAGTMAGNAGMLAIMRKAGMIADGRRAAHYLLDGRPVDLVYAALFAVR